MAFSLPVPVAYYWPEVLSSMAVAAGAAGLALFLETHPTSTIHHKRAMRYVLGRRRDRVGSPLRQRFKNGVCICLLNLANVLNVVGCADQQGEDGSQRHNHRYKAFHSSHVSTAWACYGWNHLGQAPLPLFSHSPIEETKVARYPKPCLAPAAHQIRHNPRRIVHKLGDTLFPSSWQIRSSEGEPTTDLKKP